MSIRHTDIETEMMGAAFSEPNAKHHALGAAFGIEIASPEEVVPRVERATELPMGSIVFVASRDKALRDKPEHDKIAIILGHTEVERDGRMKPGVQAMEMRPRSGSWSTHNLRQGGNELADAIAALRVIYDPETEFGSDAVFSRTTTLLDTTATGTLGQAGCDSHSRGKLDTTLGTSQLLEPYKWRIAKIPADSGRVRRAGGKINALLPGQSIPGQPTAVERSQQGMFHRIVRLDADPTSELKGVGTHAVLRGIEHAVSSDKFADRDRPVADVRAHIMKKAKAVTK